MVDFLPGTIEGLWADLANTTEDYNGSAKASEDRIAKLESPLSVHSFHSLVVTEYADENSG